MKILIFLIGCFRIVHPGVIVPSPDAGRSKNVKIKGIEPRTVRDPPRIPNMSQNSKRHGLDNRPEHLSSKSGDSQVGIFDDLSAPCRLLLEPFKAEMMKDESTFLININPRATNVHLVDLNLGQDKSEVFYFRKV